MKINKFKKPEHNNFVIVFFGNGVFQKAYYDDENWVNEYGDILDDDDISSWIDITKEVENSDKLPDEISQEELANEYKDYLTVGKLLNFIKRNNIPESAKVVSQRVEDFYYKRNGWCVVYKEGEHYHSHIKLVDSVKKEPDEYKVKLSDLEKVSTKNLKEQYSPIWGPVKYKDDDNLYLDLHY